MVKGALFLKYRGIQAGNSTDILSVWNLHMRTLLHHCNCAVTLASWLNATNALVITFINVNLTMFACSQLITVAAV